MNEKVVGYILLIVGIVVMTYAAVSVIGVFTNRSKPVDVFALSGISLDLGKIAGSDLPSAQGQKLDRADTKTEIFGPEMVNTPMNLVAHLLFMGFLATVGFKIASLGTMLVRPIKVKLKTSEESSKNTPG